MGAVELVEDAIRDCGEVVGHFCMAYIRTDFEYLTDKSRDFPMTSPVEQLFWVEYSRRKQAPLRPVISVPNEAPLPFDLLPQFNDPELTGPYRLDFGCNVFGPLYSHALLFFDDALIRSAMQDVKVPRVAIELDGHAWHEKSPDQVQRDKERERFLVSKGWTLIRFSGREIINNAGGKFYELTQIVKPMFESLRKEFSLALKKAIVAEAKP